jgi:16S rRNA processing protein RimM
VTDRLVVGLVRGVNGLRGAVRVEILSDNPDRFAVGSVLHRESDDRPLTILSAHRDGPGLLVRFREVSDRPTADALRDVYLEADASDLPTDTFYWHDIVGCTVVTTDGEELGSVADVFRVGGSEVYVVRGRRGETLVPAVASVVKKFDPGSKHIEVDRTALGLDDPGEPEAKGEAEPPAEAEVTAESSAESETDPQDEP